MFGSNATATFNHTEYDCFILHGNILAALFAADIGFISLDDAGERATTLKHERTDVLCDTPGSLVCHTKMALNFFGGDAVFGN
jgi:hypothetical protein